MFPGSATFPVEATKTTACTITNKLKQGKLTVIKHVINNNGGTKVASNFQMSLGDTTTFPGSEAGTTFTLDEGYTFTVGETIDPSYTMSTSGTCSGAIVADTTQTCTVTNDDKPAYLIVIKHVINDNGGTKKAADFTTTISGVTTATPSAPGVEAPGVTNELTTVGSYSVDEGAHVGYTRTLSADCSGTIALGQTRTCTITNDDQGAHLIVIKHVVNDNGGSAKSSDFTMTVTNAANPAPFPGADTPGTNVAINAGSYSVGESSLDGYQQTSASTDCSGNIALGETKTCTITNDDIPAHLIVIKTVINNFGLTAVPSDFTMTINDVTASGGNSFPGSGSGTDKTLTTVGTYSVTESSLPGYTASSSVDCSGIIALGQTKTCTITNRDSKAAPAGTTGQSAVLQDSFTIASGIRPGGGASSVTFTLYTDAACTQPAKNDGTAVETQNFVPSQDGKSGGANTVKGVGPVLTSGTYYWKAAWSGDNYNQPFTTSCGKAADEQTAITFSGQ